MSDYTSTPHELGWDDEITSDGGEFHLLEEGDYTFTVTAFERGRFPGSAKIPACNKAILTLSVDDCGNTARVRHELILYSTMEWTLSAFFRAIGQKKKGEPLRPRWNEVVGSKGRARFKVRTYTRKDGSEGQVNEADRFYDYDEAAMQSAGQTEMGGWTEPAGETTPWSDVF